MAQRRKKRTQTVQAKTQITSAPTTDDKKMTAAELQNWFNQLVALPTAEWATTLSQPTKILLVSYIAGPL